MKRRNPKPVDTSQGTKDEPQIKNPLYVDNNIRDKILSILEAFVTNTKFHLYLDNNSSISLL